MRIRSKRPCLTLQPQQKPTAPKAITIKHLANELAEQHQLSKKQARENDGRPHRHDHQAPEVGERVKITGLGILQVRNRAARMGRNPATGEPIQIKASKKVAFRASKELKEAV